MAVALLLDLENLGHRSFAAEAYRTVERTHGKKPDLCQAFGSHIHVGHTQALANQLGIQLIVTEFAVKNAADKTMVEAAKSLIAKGYKTIVIGSGDRGFLHWLSNVRRLGIRLECVSRAHQLCEEADDWYAAVYRMGAKRMNLPTESDLRTAALDCMPDLQNTTFRLDHATSLMRSYRIVPKNTPGRVFFARYPDLFKLSPDGTYVALI